MKSGMRTETEIPAAVVCVGDTGENGLGIVRSLGRNGIPSYVLGVKGHLNLAASSRYCTERIAVRQCKGALLYRALMTISGQCKYKPVLFFDSDNMMVALSSYAEAVGKRFLLTSPLHSILSLVDKRFQMKMAQKAGLDVPRTWLPHTWRELAAIDAAPGRRLLAKPSPAAYPDERPFKVLMSNRVDNLVSSLKGRVSSPEGLIIQEYVEGPDSQVYVALCYKSFRTGLSPMVTGIKLRQYGPPAGGVMAVGRAVDCQPVRDITLRLISSLNYSGIIGVEYKYSAIDEKYYFIEISPRTEVFHTLGKKAGLDLPMLAYWDHVDHEKLIHTNLRQDARHYWINFKADVGSLLSSHEFRNLKQIIKPYVSVKEWAVFSIDDPIPWLRSSKALIKEYTKRLFLKITKVIR